MVLFRRKKTDSVLPEVDEYYQAEKRDRTWLAWLLAFVSVVLVVLLLVGIFFFGRWAYNSITNSDSTPETVSVNEGQTANLPSFDGATEGQASDSSNQSTTDSDTANSSDSASENTENKESQTSESEGTVNAPAQTTTPSNSATTDNSGKGDQNPLPDTGPADTLKIFVIVTVLGTIGYQLADRLKLSRN